MIVLSTDFGLEGPYIGQMKAVLAREAPGVAVIDLFSDFAPCAVRPAAYLLAAYADAFPADCVHLAVVDPGVGSERGIAVVEADGRWYVGPDNGLLMIAARRAQSVRWFAVDWRPEALSASFHGRDVFAPLAARVARHRDVSGSPVPIESRIGYDWPEDLSEVAYVDRFGNAITGLRAAKIPHDAELVFPGYRLRHARTFADVPAGCGFWYGNANGLVEIAVNQGRADAVCALAVGTRVNVSRP